MKMEYTVRMYTGNEFLFKTFTNKRKALHFAYVCRKVFWEVTVLMNVVGDDFGIAYPDKNGVIREYIQYLLSYSSLFQGGYHSIRYIL